MCFLFLGFGSRFQFAFQHCFHFRFTLHLRNVQLCELWPCPCTWAHHASMLFSIAVNSFIETKHSKFGARRRPLNLLLLFCVCVDVNEASPKVCKSPLSVYVHVYVCVGNLFARCLCSEHFELTVPRVVTVVIVYS